MSQLHNCPTYDTKISTTLVNLPPTFWCKTADTHKKKLFYNF